MRKADAGAKQTFDPNGPAIQRLVPAVLDRYFRFVPAVRIGAVEERPFAVRSFCLSAVGTIVARPNERDDAWNGNQHGPSKIQPVDEFVHARLHSRLRAMEHKSHNRGRVADLMRLSRAWVPP